jgi:hypothetical protein
MGEKGAVVGCFQGAADRWLDVAASSDAVVHAPNDAVEGRRLRKLAQVGVVQAIKSSDWLLPVVVTYRLP